MENGKIFKIRYTSSTQINFKSKLETNAKLEALFKTRLWFK